MSCKVAILGGGVGGLSAAHELIERGFAVSVFERSNVFGGKARSIYVPNSGTGGRIDLPGEHGFRSFPAFYRHLPDTLMRIPLAANVSVFNKAARRAVNTILTKTGSTAIPASVWPMQEPDCFKPQIEYDRLRFNMGLPHTNLGPI